MFCYQCEQTAKGTGCTVSGVCGKVPEVAALQDLLTGVIKGVSLFASEGRKVGFIDKDVDRFAAFGLFATLTNVNFDDQELASFIDRTAALRDKLKAGVASHGGNVSLAETEANLIPEKTLEGKIEQGKKMQWQPAVEAGNPDIKSLQDIVLLGIRGVAAYAHHAAILGQEDETVYGFIHDALAKIAKNEGSLEDWVGMALKCGEINLRAMELLDAGNTGAFGHPVPTKVSLGAKAGKAILISGHDLKDLEELLKQTAGKGINVYTHGEMLPAHGYPELKKFSHLCGHYGTAWQNQHKEFAEFPGSILMTTNCIQKPRDSYAENIFTCGPVGWPGVKHVGGHDFSPVIEKALAMDGFATDQAGKTVMVGFARNAVLGVAPQVIEAVKNKNIRHFFLVGGCDGVKSSRGYYADFVEQVPQDCVVLTLACGKFKFFDKDLGDIGGIPRLLDVGQCNDAYSAVKIAVALAEAFG
ncbi:MAG: hydroxylamine reductase, partial [Rubrobacteridae bacterium]|nr:hydroxylamine reductase [Rubrobacteridae bacterium]